MPISEQNREKLINWSKFVAAVGLLITAFAAAFGFDKVSTLVTSSHMNKAQLRLAENDWRDYDRDIRMLKRDRRAIMQQKYDYQQRGIPVAPSIAEEETDINDQIKEYKEKQRKLDEEIQKRKSG